MRAYKRVIKNLSNPIATKSIALSYRIALPTKRTHVITLSSEQLFSMGLKSFVCSPVESPLLSRFQELHALFTVMNTSAFNLRQECVRPTFADWEASETPEIYICTSAVQKKSGFLQQVGALSVYANEGQIRKLRMPWIIIRLITHSRGACVEKCRPAATADKFFISPWLGVEI